MKCTYCQRECRKTNTASTYTWQCDYHGSVRIQFTPIKTSDAECLCITFICRYKETNYRVNFYHGVTDPTHPKFSISKIPFDPKKPSETVFTLDFIPEITPENVESKIPIYLMFS